MKGSRRLEIARTWAVVVAAGDGRRFGGAKQFADLAGRALLAWSLDRAREVCGGIVLVIPPSARLAEEWDADAVVPGGRTRSESVRAGLAAVPAAAEFVVVHDAARPLAAPRLWEAVLEAVAGGADAAVPAVAVTDTIKRVGPAGELTTLERSSLVAVQTPQAFRAEVIRRVHERCLEATDDAALVEQSGGRVELVPGDPGNLKVTLPEDLLVAEALLRARRA